MRNKEFEKAAAEYFDLPVEDVKMMYAGAGRYRSFTYHIEIAWTFWCLAKGFDNPYTDEQPS